MFATLSMASSQVFENKAFHPKATALGSSVTAMKGDASLLFYNPASIGFIESPQVYSGYTELYPQVSDDNLNVLNAGAAYSLPSLGTFGIGLSQFSPNFWTERTIIFSFASTEILENLSLGVSAKILSWSAESPQGEYAVPEPALSSTSMTFDIGMLYYLPEIFEQNDFQIGFALDNLTRPSSASNGSSDARIPLHSKIGFALLSHKYNYSLYGTAALKGSDIKLSAGYEILALQTTTFGIANEFFVRLGAGRIVNNETQGDYNGGFGFKIERICIDYSYSYQTAIRNIGGISSISIGYDF